MDNRASPWWKEHLPRTGVDGNDTATAKYVRVGGNGRVGTAHAEGCLTCLHGLIGPMDGGGGRKNGNGGEREVGGTNGDTRAGRCIVGRSGGDRDKGIREGRRIRAKIDATKRTTPTSHPLLPLSPYPCLDLSPSRLKLGHCGLDSGQLRTEGLEVGLLVL